MTREMHLYNRRYKKVKIARCGYKGPDISEMIWTLLTFHIAGNFLVETTKQHSYTLCKECLNSPKTQMDILAIMSQEFELSHKIG